MKNFLVFNLIFGFALLAVSLNGTEVKAQCADEHGNDPCAAAGVTEQGNPVGNQQGDPVGVDQGNDVNNNQGNPVGNQQGNQSNPQGGGGGQNTSQPSLGPPITIFDPVQKSITEIFRAILDIIMVFAIPIIVFFIVWAGFLYVKAAGNASEIEKAHKALLYALVGGLIILGANLILAVITNTINLFVN